MKLALKKSYASDAKWYEIGFSELIKIRLVSEYSHGGIVIGNTLYHVTMKDGLHSSEFTPENWDLYEIGGNDEKALSLFEKYKGTKYDYLGLFAFVTPFQPGSSKRMYCFEWCALAMGIEMAPRVTPEMLLAAALNPKRGSANPPEWAW